MKHAPRAALAALALVLTALVAACGGSDHDSADVTFAQQMIPHHRQAVEMARMAATHDAGPEVRALAGKIEAAQGPEIRTMTGWLRDWDEKVPTSTGTSGRMDGMMSGSDMKALDRARGADFDELFLTQMVEHHRGAIDMARTELDEGSSAEAKKLARSVVKTQGAEIAQMKKLLANP